MNYLLIPALLLASGLSAAQDKIYRCPNNEYINNSKEAETRGCKLIDVPNVSIIAAPRPRASVAPAAGSISPSATTPRVVSSEQRARDSDARQILEAELKKLESRQAELLKEYNHGEPDKQGIEGRNHQRYLDRVAELKANISRNDSDIAGIRRELSRLPASK